MDFKGSRYADLTVIDVDGVMTKDLSLMTHLKAVEREHLVVTDVDIDAIRMRC